MKNILKIISTLIVLALALPLYSISADSGAPAKADLRGVWVATVSNIDYPSKSSADPQVLKQEAITILDNAKNMGINAVFLQIRPSSDALYKSDYFPWSKYLTGTQGLAPDDGFDPLEFWINEAHSRGIELHAWINPYRVTKKAPDGPNYDFNSLAQTNPARLHQEWVVKYSDGNLYYDPGIPEVRRLIVDSVLEIIQKYAVDGIHFDDYFYPGKSFNDKATFDKYGTGYASLDDWRRANVNTLISEVSQAIKQTGRNISFGISPFGIWANKSSAPEGSDTNGLQSYSDHYADSRKWVQEGIIDYIAPQLYWNIGYSIADYSKLLAWWEDTVDGTGVDLYIGQAAYRSGNSDPSSAWYGVAEIEKQLKLNATNPLVKGSIFFSYSSLTDSPALGSSIKVFYQQRDGIVPAIPVTISRPSENIRTSFGSFYLNGTSDPAKPLYINGKPIENRSVQGYYGILMPLEKGENIFTIAQEGSCSTRVIYRTYSTSTPAKMSKAEIPSSSVFPQSPEYRTPGEKITLKCQAPIGSTVTVKLGGKIYKMKPSGTASYGTGIYPTTFSYVYTVPKYSGAPRNIDLGTPAYTMKYKGTVKTRTAPAKVVVIMKGSPFYAKVTKEVIDTYNAPDTSNGAAYELYQGMVDYITGMTGNYVRLSSGQWVRKSNVSTYTSKTLLKPAIKTAEYSTAVKWDTLKLNVAAPAAAYASFDGSLLKVNVSTVISAALPVLPDDSLFTSVTVSTSGGKAVYTMKLKENQRIDGYCMEKTPKGISLKVKRHVSAMEANLPLSGITVMVDAGHGGSEQGAIGPLGLKYPEKTINLNTALKLRQELEKLGATVLMTRTDNTTVSLEARLAASRKAKPDMFISIHANSMEDNVDISRISGLSTYYREAFTKPLADAVLKSSLTALSRNNQGLHVKNFYVMRGTWTPSMLIESGFVPNPTEFEQLIDENQQTILAQSMAQAIAQYFAN